MSRTRIKNGLAKDIYGIEIDEEQYKKCIDNLDKVLKRNDIDKVDWKVINADYLKWNTTIKFQYIVGNPPYITYRIERGRTAVCKEYFLYVNQRKI